LNILVVNTSDIYGGASRAAYRLHKSLLAFGGDSKMLVQIKYSDDCTVIGPSTKVKRSVAKLRPTFDLTPVLYYRKRTKTFFSPSWLPFSNIVDQINKINPDIVHLHWICGGMMTIEDIFKINAPIVWSLHDMWAFTGGCHYDETCGAYKESCGNCKVLGSNKANDLSKKVWNRKNAVYSQLNNMTLVGLSKWITGCAQESSLFRDKRVVNLPNPINPMQFKPINMQKARELWKVPTEKRLVLFGAIRATIDPRKGFKELGESLHLLNRHDIEFVVFGSNETQLFQDSGFKFHFLGHLISDFSLSTLYSAVDVMVVTSLQENLSNTIMESLACGTPVVAFDVGGNSDLIDHLKNGYLANPFEVEDLAKGIMWVLNHENSVSLSNSARNKVLNCFGSELLAKNYLGLYKMVTVDYGQ
jgi:glycosyltransferase involved in cell wall biosynthesis